MKLRFVKMHGAGNDFVMIDNRDGALSLKSAEIARLANRPDGIGCEGVIFVENSDVADFRMRFYNPDGTEAELCGNGARCVAAFAREIGAVTSDTMRFETLAGEVAAELLPDGRVRIAMVEPKDLRQNFVNSGVPHAIVPVDDLESADVEGEGRRIRHSTEFAPDGTNVDFVEYRGPGKVVNIRTYERGVEAESGACGTGAVASALIGVAQYGLEFPVRLMTRFGHLLEVGGEFDGSGFSKVTLTGPVKRVFEGVCDL